MKFFLTLLLAVLCTFQGTAVQAKPRLFAAPQTRDNWRSVRTNHLFVIGNADAEKLRQVAAWLEFFHSAFARLVSRNVLDSSVPTTVIVFRDDASFTPFKPLYQVARLTSPVSFNPATTLTTSHYRSILITGIRSAPLFTSMFTCTSETTFREYPCG